MSTDRFSATRYLESSAFLNEGFASRFLNDVFRKDFRTLGPSPGIDVCKVVQACFAAKRLYDVRDRLRRALLAATILAYVVAVWLNVLWLPAIPLILLVILHYRFAFDIHYGQIASKLLDGTIDLELDTSIPVDAQVLLRLIDEERRGNVVVFGGFLPFIGMGTRTLSWNVALSLKPKDASTETTEFAASDLNLYILEGVADLDIPELSADEIVFVRGNAVRWISTLFDEAALCPRFRTEPSDLPDSLKDGGPCRCYKRLQLHITQAQLILSYLFRTTVTAGSLCVEVASYLVTPIKEQFKRIDTLPKNRRLKDELKLLVDLPVLVSTDIIWIVSLLISSIFNPLPLLLRESRYLPNKKKRDDVLHDRTYEFGPSVTIRDRYSSGFFDSYFQQQDAIMFNKIIDARLLDLMIQFLDEAHVDTSDLREQKTTIINSGIMLTGSGSFSASAVAVGKSSKTNVGSIFTKPTQESSK